MKHDEDPQEDGPHGPVGARAAIMAVRDPGKVGREHGENTAGERALEPEADRPATIHEHMLARTALHVVEPCAKRVARMFPRLVRENGLLTVDDLLSIGHVALLRAARAFDVKVSRDFASFARHMVRYRMLDALDGLLFEERVKRAAARAEDNYGAFFADDDYNVVKHDEDEARRRFRAFANGLFVSMFVSGVEEAQQCLDTAEVALRREYARAVELLRKALACFVEADRQIMALVYRDGLPLKDASARLRVPYGTARARHARVLKVLHELLVEHGIDRAPRPLVVPDADALDRSARGARAPPRDDTEADEIKPRGSKGPGESM